MANQIIADIGTNEDLKDVIRKCNYNFKTIASNQIRKSREDLRRSEQGIQEDIDGIDAKFDDYATVESLDDYVKKDEIPEIEGGDYEKLINKPSIESHVLIGDQTFAALGLTRMTNSEIDAMLAS